MSVFERGKYFHVEFKWDGKRVQQSSKSTRRNAAVTLERNLRKALEEGKTLDDIKRGRADAPTCAEAIDEYIKANGIRWSKSTLKMHRLSAQQLAKSSIGKMRLRDIQTKHIQEYQSARVEDDGVSGRTVNVEMATLRQMLKANKQWARLADEYKGLKERHDVGRALDTDEIEKLENACKQSVSRALYPAFLISRHTGLRSKELRTLRWKQVDLDSNPSFITVGEDAKTEAGKGRLVPLSPLAKSVLNEWKSKFPFRYPSHFVFPSEQYHFQGDGGALKLVSCDPTKPVASFHQSWKTAKKLANVECRWHDCRHTFISTLAETHTPDATIMSLAGHVSRKMLERYSHSRNTAKIDAINRAFGVGPELSPAKIKRIR